MSCIAGGAGKKGEQAAIKYCRKEAWLGLAGGTQTRGEPAVAADARKLDLLAAQRKMIPHLLPIVLGLAHALLPKSHSYSLCHSIIKTWVYRKNGYLVLVTTYTKRER